MVAKAHIADGARLLGAAHLTALELAPDAFVRGAVKAGLSYVGLRLAPAMAGGLSYDVRRGTAGHATLLGAMADTGVAVNEIEFIPLTPDIQIAKVEPLLATGADIGARSLTVSGDDPDASRLADHLAALAEMAAGYGLRVDVEFMRWRPIASYSDALDLLTRAGHPNTGILLDALHLDRSGGDFSVPQMGPDAPVKSVQLCDAPATRPVGDAETIAEAREGRLVPGAGALPLSQLVSRLHPETYVSVEVPDATRPPEERLIRAAEATRALLHHKEIAPCPED